MLPVDYEVEGYATYIFCKGGPGVLPRKILKSRDINGANLSMPKKFEKNVCLPFFMLTSTSVDLSISKLI